MAEANVKNSRKNIKIRYRGRGAQVWIYLGKMLRMFVYQNDWKVLPMAALIAGLVGMVIRNRLFKNMEGCLMGSFAMVMVCIWNGCFNSIQVICRERDVIKREHRSGMHISSYIASHMLYQALLCILQTGVTLYVTMQVGVKYNLGKSMITGIFMLDYGISMFLITYASDMLSLWVSAIAHTTTTAMTIMPFVLIFQLVFSGGLLTLPSWAEHFTPFTISNPGLKVLTAQSDYNHQPLVSIWNTVESMKNKEVGGTITLGQVLDILADTENPAVQEIRGMELGKIFTVGEIADALEKSATFQAMKGEAIIQTVTVRDILNGLNEAEALKPYLDTPPVAGLNITVGGVLNALLNENDLAPMLDKTVTQKTTLGDILEIVDAAGVMERYREVQLGGTTTVGAVADLITSNPDLQSMRNESVTIKTTVGKILDLLGPERVESMLETSASEAAYKADYENDAVKIAKYWFRLMVFILAFSLLATITLEFIDKDKR